MKTGDIIFTFDNSIISKLIRYFDKGKFSHCVIAISETEILEAQYSTKSHIVPFYFENYEIIDMGLTEEQMKRIQDLSPTLVGHRYDYIQILSYFWKDVFNHDFKIVNSPSNYICSEIVEILLQEVGVIPQDKRLRDYTPNELYRYLKSITESR